MLSANLYNFRCVILLLQDRSLVLCDRIFTRTIASPNSVQPLTRPRHSIQFNCGTIVSLQQPLCHLSQFYLYAIAASQKRSRLRKNDRSVQSSSISTRSRSLTVAIAPPDLGQSHSDCIFTRPIAPPNLVQLPEKG